MCFCTGKEHQRFQHRCPIVEGMLVVDGILPRE
ncbi:hypothetical protein KK483_03590 [Streptomyces sp. FIT100]|nr:hypothetical protein KK483_03590 [Streptomyces sp. FIT100]